MFDRLRERIRERRQRRNPDDPVPDPISPATPVHLTWKERLIMAFLKTLFGVSSNAVKGFINENELWKSFGAASFGGVLVSVAVLILTTLSANAATIFSAPVAGMAVALISMVLTLLRQISAGQHAIVTPAVLTPTNAVATVSDQTSAPIEPTVVVDPVSSDQHV